MYYIDVPQEGNTKDDVTWLFALVKGGVCLDYSDAGDRGGIVRGVE